MRRRTNMKKPRPLNIWIHYAVLWRASQRSLNKCGKPFRTWRITLFNNQTGIINNPHWIISSRN
jgi:hypothetical protein